MDFWIHPEYSAAFLNDKWEMQQKRYAYCFTLKCILKSLFPPKHDKKNHKNLEILKNIMPGVLRESYGNRWSYWRR